jgi:hypothetical protein
MSSSADEVEVRLFPLPRVVLLPGALLPLHVFEPRYRALVADALADDRRIGVATLVPDASPQPGQPPAIYPVIGVGQIIQHQPFADGRSNIVLQHVATVESRAPCDQSTPYRVCRARTFGPRDPAGSGVDRLRVLVLQLGAAHPQARDDVLRLARLPDLSLVDAMARKLLDAVDDRLAFLGCERVADQVSLLVDRLAEVLPTGGSAGDA